MDAESIRPARSSLLQACRVPTLGTVGKFRPTSSPMVKLSLLVASTILPSSVFAQTTHARSASESHDSGAPAETAQETSSPPGAPPALEEDSIPLKQTPALAEAHAMPVKQTRGESQRGSDTSKSPPTDSERTKQNEGEDSEVRDGEASVDGEESRQFGYFAVGPAMLSISGYDEFGVALGGGGRFPFHERMALNAGVTWGLTTFDRTGKWWEEARRIGSWTTRAYGNVTEWVVEGEDDNAFRAVAALYAYIGLLFPYAVSGMMYILGPFAATSYVDFHMEATFHLSETRSGPYVGAGLGTAAIIFPIEREMKGAFGPTLNLGCDFGWFGVEARGFYSPPYLHGEPSIYRTDIFTGQFLFRFQGK